MKTVIHPNKETIYYIRQKLELTLQVHWQNKYGNMGTEIMLTYVPYWYDSDFIKWNNCYHDNDVTIV